MGFNLFFTGHVRCIAEVLRRKYGLPRRSRFTITALIKTQGEKKASEILAKEYADDAEMGECDIKPPQGENGSPRHENGNGNMLNQRASNPRHLKLTNKPSCDNLFYLILSKT